MIGVLGGTFAPIHNGHLRVAIEAREQLGLSEVRLVPAARPPLRAVPANDAKRRLRWTRLAVKGEPGLAVDGRELRRKGPSYTVDTLAAIRREVGRTPLCLLLGADAAARFEQWHRWEQILELAHLVVFNRDGRRAAFPAALQALDRDAPDPAALRSRPGGLFFTLTMPPLPISATDIRRRLAAGQSVRGLVPERVIADFSPQDLKAFGQDAK